MKKILSILFIGVVVVSLVMIPAALVGASPGLVGEWLFDEGSGTTAFDSSGNANHGTLKPSGSEPTWVSGKFGNALSFDGSNDYVEIPDHNTLDITGDLTLEAWIKPDSVSYIAQGEIVGKWVANDTSYYFAIKDGELQMRISATGSDYYNVEETSNANLNINTWYHVAGVYDASAQDIKLYINGVEESTTVTGTIPSSIHSGSENLKIGGFSPGYYFDGIIDEVRTYNEALSADQIAVLASPISVIEVDIKPGSDPNSINLKDQGVLPVAILGSSIDVYTIDLDTITLGGAGVASRGSAKAPKLAVSFEYVDGDGEMDLVVFFRVQDLSALDETTIELMLEAETTGGVPIAGTDTVNVVPG